MSDLALDLPLVGTQLIEASAGTGKTYTIAGLYLRLIVERRLEVRQILVVTFTTAATEELKDRLRRRLNVAADIAEAIARKSELSEALRVHSEALFAVAVIERQLNAGTESARELAQRLRLAAVSMDEAAISTIHGFCQRALREQAFPSGEPLDAGELIGSDRDLYEQIAGDYWRSLASDPARADDFDVLVNECTNVAQLARVLGQLCATDAVIYPQPEVGGSAADLAATQARFREANEALIDAWKASGSGDLARVLAHSEEGHLKEFTRSSQDSRLDCRLRISVLAAVDARSLRAGSHQHERIGGCDKAQVSCAATSRISINRRSMADQRRCVDHSTSATLAASAA